MKDKPGVDPWVLSISTPDPPGDYPDELVVLPCSDSVSGTGGDQGSTGVSLNRGFIYIDREVSGKNWFMW